MDKKDRQKIVFEIGDLIESNCKGCIYNGKAHRGNPEHCATQCQVGKRLRELGNTLSPNNRAEVEKMEVSKEAYLDLKAQGLTDKEVRAKFAIDHNKLYRLKKEWDMVGERGKPVVKAVSEAAPKTEPEDWKVTYEELKQEMDALVTENANLLNAFDDIEKENGRLRKELDSLVASVEEVNALKTLLKFYL